VKNQCTLVYVSVFIALRFNDLYGPTFTEPEALLSPAPLVLGTDGRKMSKSAGNTSPLGASGDDTAQAFRGARTHAERVISYEPERRPEIASLLTIAALCRGERPEDLAEAIREGR